MSQRKMLVALWFVLVATIGCSTSPPADVVIEHEGETYTFPGSLEYDDSVWMIESVEPYPGSVLHGTYRSPGRDDRLMHHLYMALHKTKKSAFFLEAIDPTTGQWAEHGLSVLHFVDGRTSFSKYRYGDLHGRDALYYEDGQLYWEYFYEHGKREGISRGFYEDGQPQWEAEYRGDTQVSATMWDENGNQTN